jgi:hypothetical protein
LRLFAVGDLSICRQRLTQCRIFLVGVFAAGEA